MLNPNFEEAEDSEESAVATELKNYINGMIPDKEAVAWGIRIAGIVLAVFVLGWAIKVLQVIICFFRKKPYLRTEVIGIIAGIVQVLLAIISGFIILAVKLDLFRTITRLPVLSDVFAAVPFMGQFMDIMGTAVTPTIMFSAFIPGILVLVNLVYSIIYGFFKRSFKRSL
jgi:hypothetical protein